MIDTALTRDAVAVQTSSSVEPDGAPRIVSLDVLRGIAILGILFMNINDMGGSLWMLFSGEIRHLGWTLADQIAWFLREVFANGTARCMLEMLFGAGMVILTDRIAEGDGRWSGMRRYYWRNFVLFLFGIVHLFVLLWPGDILHTYGIAAMVAFLFRRLKPGRLLAIGLLMAVLQLGGGGYALYDAGHQRAAMAAIGARQAAGQPLTAADRKIVKQDAERRAKRAKRHAQNDARIVAEDRARTGTFLTWAGSAWQSILSMVGKGLELIFVWEAAGTMLIGAALYKWGVLQGRRSRGFYKGLILCAYAVGLGSRALGAFDDMRFDDAPSLIWSLGEVARVATTLGHVALVQLMLGSVRGARLLRPFEAAGRTALSIYIMQTLICLWVLYPPQALGLYGRQGWAALMLTAFAINAGLLLLANWWVRHYRIAPVEWAWRSIVEGRRLPFRRRVPQGPGALPLPA